MRDGFRWPIQGPATDSCNAADGSYMSLAENSMNNWLHNEILCSMKLIFFIPLQKLYEEFFVTVLHSKTTTSHTMEHSGKWRL